MKLISLLAGSAAIVQASDLTLDGSGSKIIMDSGASSAVTLTADELKVLKGLTAKVSTLETKTSTLETNVAAVDTRTTALETKTGALETNVAAVETRTTALETKTGALETSAGQLRTDVDGLITDTAGWKSYVDSKDSRVMHDMAANAWCGYHTGFSSNNHAVWMTPHYPKSCNTVCQELASKVGSSGTCRAGNTRIAPNLHGMLGGGGRWSSHYWNQGCSGSTGGNGNTYCCCTW